MLPSPATTTVIIQEEDKAVTEATATFLTHHKALFLTTTINFDNCTFKDIVPPAFTPAFEGALKKKSIKTKARALIGLWNNVVAPEKLDINDTSYTG